jgi:hypothetical protein
MAKIIWHMTTETYSEYVRLLNDMALAAKDADKLRYQETLDAFKALPNFPVGIHTDLDRIVPKVDDTSTRIVTLGSTN